LYTSISPPWPFQSQIIYVIPSVDTDSEDIWLYSLKLPGMMAGFSHHRCMSVYFFPCIMDETHQLTILILCIGHTTRSKYMANGQETFKTPQ